MTATPLAPLEPILEDPAVQEILIDGYQNVYVEKDGQLVDVPTPFRDNGQLMELITYLAEAMGRRVDESHPMVDMRLPDASRVNVVIPPISLIGPVMTIRKFHRQVPYSMEELIGFETLSAPMAEFLRAAVGALANIAVCGGSGAGKTVMLNTLANMVPEGERIITLETASELRLRQKRVVALETRPPNLEGRGEISMSDLVINALRMRPERLIVGEVRGEEALHLIAGINSGHNGSMFSLHAANPRDALARLETMMGMANPSIPLLGLREQIASGLTFAVHMERLRDGSRKVLSISEVQGVEAGVVLLTDLFVFQSSGMADGKARGRHTATGKVPAFLKTLRDSGISLPLEMFVPHA